MPHSFAKIFRFDHRWSSASNIFQLSSFRLSLKPSISAIHAQLIYLLLMQLVQEIAAEDYYDHANQNIQKPIKRNSLIFGIMERNRFEFKTGLFCWILFIFAHPAGTLPVWILWVLAVWICSRRQCFTSEWPTALAEISQ